MSKLHFIDADFKRLAKISNLNASNRNKETGEYTSKHIREEVEREINKIQEKMRMILPEIGKYDYLDGFTYNICQNRAISNQYKKGGFRSMSWIYIYENILRDYLKRKFGIKKYVHYYIPQIQISINKTDFSSASLWFEASALRVWKEHIINYLTENPIDDKHIYFTVLRKGKNIFPDHDWATSEMTKEFINLISNENGLEAGLHIYYDEGEIINKEITNLIKDDLEYLFHYYYKPMFGDILRNKSKREKIRNWYRARKRKESNRITTRKIFRRGNKGGYISREHEKMKKGYKHYLKKTYKAIVSAELDYVDLTIEKKNKIMLYEIKTDDRPHICIRNGIGQLLFYAWQKRNSNKEIELNIIGKNPMNEDISEFENFIKDEMKITFRYLPFDYKSYNRKHGII